MKLTFDIIFFPNIARVAYLFGFLELITVIVICIRILKDRNSRCGLFWENLQLLYYHRRDMWFSGKIRGKRLHIQPRV